MSFVLSYWHYFSFGAITAVGVPLWFWYQVLHPFSTIWYFNLCKFERTLSSSSTHLDNKFLQYHFEVSFESILDFVVGYKVHIAWDETLLRDFKEVQADMVIPLWVGWSAGFAEAGFFVSTISVGFFVFARSCAYMSTCFYPLLLSIFK